MHLSSDVELLFLISSVSSLSLLPLGLRTVCRRHKDKQEEDESKYDKRSQGEEEEELDIHSSSRTVCASRPATRSAAVCVQNSASGRSIGMIGISVLHSQTSIAHQQQKKSACILGGISYCFYSHCFYSLLASFIKTCKQSEHITNHSFIQHSFSSAPDPE